MRPRFRWTVLLLVLVLPVLGADKGKNKKKKQDRNVTAATAADYQVLARIKVIAGTLTNVETGGKTLTFQYQYQYLAPKKGKGKASAYKLATGRKEFDLQAIDEVKVRLLQLPVEYDDKGHAKKYSAKELKELKGKDHLPGYTGSWENLAPGQIVKIYLVPPKKKAAEKGQDKVQVEDKAAFDLLEDNKKPQIKMIVVLAETDATTTPRSKKKGT
jgi:hypothetical protein